MPSGCWLSLSARRAWIEIIDDLLPSTTRIVALRKESVDRNVCLKLLVMFIPESLSARRAWIEILIWLVKFVCFVGRSPQGERG